MVKQVFSRDNQYVKQARQLKQRKCRDKKGLFLLEGIRGLEDVLRSSYELEAILINSFFMKNPRAEELLSKVDKYVPVCQVSDNIFKELTLTESPQGILLIIKQKEYSLDQIFAFESKFMVVADGIQDPGNLGTIIRTSGAAGASAVLVTKGCVDIYNPKVMRASMGGLFFLPVLTIENRESLIMLLQERGYKIVVADLEGETQYYKAKLNQSIALIIGNENNGPSKVFKEKADYTVKIPMLGKVESLNAGVAAGILIYEIVRQRIISHSI